MAAVVDPILPATEARLPEPFLTTAPAPSIDELQRQLNTATQRWCVQGDSVEVIAAYASCLNALVERAGA